MFLTDLSIKRPVVASVMSLVLVIFGLVTFQEIPTDELPDVQPPVVTIQGNTAFVYTVIDDTAKKKNIEIGKRNFGKVSVLSGLNEGDIVISEGVSKVRDKGKIKIITSNK